MLRPDSIGSIGCMIMEKLNLCCYGWHLFRTVQQLENDLT